MTTLPQTTPVRFAKSSNGHIPAMQGGATVVAAAAVGIITGATVTAPVAIASGPYRNCTEAHRDGRYNIPKGDPDYQPKLDRDNDGIACEG